MSKCRADRDLIRGQVSFSEEIGRALELSSPKRLPQGHPEYGCGMAEICPICAELLRQLRCSGGRSLPIAVAEV